MFVCDNYLHGLYARLGQSGPVGVWNGKPGVYAPPP